MIKILSFLGMFIFLTFPTNILAKKPAEYNRIEQKTIPGNFFYPEKRLKEKFLFKIKSKLEPKIKYSLTLSEKRLSELITLVDTKNVDLLTEASQRYAYQVGITSNLTKMDSEKYSGIVKDIFQKDIPILNELRDNFPANSAYWLLMQQDIDTLNILTESL